MRGLEEIKQINENPGAHFASREPQHFGPGSDAFKHENAGDALAGLFVLAALLDTMGVPMPTFSQPRTLADRPRQHAEGRKHLGMDGILSAIDAEPPFLKFWQKFNDDLLSKGLDEATYKQAKEAFIGGPTPAGALTFIGKEFDGLRAVPTQHPVQGRKSYHGEFRQVTENGTLWRAVASQSGVIEYTTPEAALSGARHARIHSEAIAQS